MSWRKLTKQPLICSDWPAAYSALNTVMYDSATQTLYMMTGTKTWASFPISQKSITAEISGSIDISGEADANESWNYLYSTDGSMILSGDAVYEQGEE